MTTGAYVHDIPSGELDEGESQYGWYESFGCLATQRFGEKLKRIAGAGGAFSEQVMAGQVLSKSESDTHGRHPQEVRRVLVAWFCCSPACWL